jgi:tRNA modification GTPase
MYAPDDTIVAIATAPGRAAIGMVRVCGPCALSVAGAVLDRAPALEPRRATFARLRACESAATARDEVVVTWFQAPASCTGQDTVEICAHGSPVVLDGIVKAAVAAGARLARPGEFTLRAFLQGKRDLVQAEAIADLVAAATPLQARTACEQLEGTLSGRIAALDAMLMDSIVTLEASLDFPDAGYHFVAPVELEHRMTATLAALDELLCDARRGRMIREGATVVIAGRTNVGKSSLFNALAGAPRAIVTPVPGTTRDLVTERIDIQGLEVTLVDTAGERDAADLVEQEGMARGARAREAADLVVLVLDGSAAAEREDDRLIEQTATMTRVVVVNKADRGSHREWQERAPVGWLAVSARSGEGLDGLRAAIARALTGAERLTDSPAVSNVRHVDLLHRARAHLLAATDAARAATPEEFVLSDLQAARQCFDEIVGTRTVDDILDQVFARFCIGK